MGQTNFRNMHTISSQGSICSYLCYSSTYDSQNGKINILYIIQISYDAFYTYYEFLVIQIKIRIVHKLNIQLYVTSDKNKLNIFIKLSVFTIVKKFVFQISPSGLFLLAFIVVSTSIQLVCY